MNKRLSNWVAADPEAAIAKLSHDWPQLSDFDRALAVSRIKAAGLSIRHIARQLGRSESLLRHLGKTLRAPGADIAAARRGQLTTNELIRRAQAEAARQQKHQSEYREFERQQKITETLQAIRAWLIQEQLNEALGEQVALATREMLMRDLVAGRLPAADPNVRHSAAEWIETCRPQTPVHDEINYIAWYAGWLAGWSFCFCRDPEIAIDALGIAGRL